jgi:hypothetical protein
MIPGTRLGEVLAGSDRPLVISSGTGLARAIILAAIEGGETTRDAVTPAPCSPNSSDR